MTTNGDATATGTQNPATGAHVRADADRLPEAVLRRAATRRTTASAAAFFDLDKTVIARSSTLVMGRTFVQDGLLSPTTAIKTLYAQAVYQLVGADHHRMEQARRAALELTRGWEAERVRRLVRETMAEVLTPYVYREALELIDWHRAEGRDVWVVSSSGEEIVEPFMAGLGVHDVIATRSGLDPEGRYDGTLEFYAYAGAKATAVRQLAEVRGYDLDASYAYSDSVTDLPLLSTVGHPVAVNPDRELRAAAEAMGWKIADFNAPVRLRDRLPDVRPGAGGHLALAALASAVAGLLVYRRLARRLPAQV